MTTYEIFIAILWWWFIFGYAVYLKVIIKI